MKQVVATAPGKVIVSGEYAVLAGAPALAMAVDRRAITTVEGRSGEISCLCTPGLDDGEWQFRVTSTGEIQWIDEVAPGVASLIDAAFVILGDSVPAVSICIDTRAFVDEATGLKLGLGSSAAAMTSTIEAVCGFTGFDHSVSRAAEAAHRKMQGGGSGVDVATSTHGGVICFVRGESIHIEPRRWPDDVECAVLWSGRPSKTQDMVGKLDSGCWTRPSGEALIEAAKDAARHWTGSGEECLSAVQAYADCLLRFDVDQGIGIFDAGHDALYEKAKAASVVYKPSGAGGGDVGIALAGNADALRTFCTEAEGHGFRQLDLALDPSGVERREVTDQ